MKACTAHMDRDVVLPRTSDTDVVQGFSDFIAELNQFQFSWGHQLYSSGQVFHESSECGFADENMDDCVSCADLKASRQQLNAAMTSRPSVQECEPRDGHDGSSLTWNAECCRENDYTWCTWALKQQTKSLGAVRKVKSVSFHDTVNVTILDHHGSIDFDVKQALVHDVLRHFWHMDGQIVSTDMMRRTLTRLGMKGNVDIGASTGSFGTESGSAQMSDLVGAHETGHTDSGAMWWPDLVASTMQSGRRKPLFISTWYLAADRIS